MASHLAEIAHVSELKTATNGNQYVVVTTKAIKKEGIITPAKRIAVFDDIELYEIGDKIWVE